MSVSIRRRIHGRAAKRGDYRTPPLLDFVTRAVSREDPALERLRLSLPKEGLPPISIGPDEGRLLDFLVRACGARKAVEAVARANPKRIDGNALSDKVRRMLGMPLPGEPVPEPKPEPRAAVPRADPFSPPGEN